MSTASAPRSPAPGPAEQRAKDAGVRLLTRFSGTIRVGRAYQVDNQVFISQLKGLLSTMEPLLEEVGEAVLVALADDLYLNGVRIPYRSANVKFHRHVVSEFQRKQIAGFRAQRGLTLADLQVFFRLFLDADAQGGPALLAACLAQGADHFLPAIHASTEAPDEEFRDLSHPAPLEFDPTETPTEMVDAAAAAPRGAARKNFPIAVSGARSLLMTTSLHGSLELRHAKRVVQPLVDGAFAKEPVVVGLHTLGHHDEFTYAHAVNVCIVAVSMGHFLEMDRRALADLGVAALLHDVGKGVVGSHVRHPLESFTDEDRAWAERHPVEGVKLLARSTTLNPTTLRCMRVALEHHVGPRGEGFPVLQKSWATSLVSQLVSVADCYVSLLTHRSPRGAWVTPYEALGMMLGPLKTRFHAAMLWALVQTVGFYPPGQLVELDGGTIAVVLTPTKDQPSRPSVRTLSGPGGSPLPLEMREELSPLPAGRHVVRALRAEEYPKDM